MLISAVSVLVKKIITKHRSDVHYFLTDFNPSVMQREKTHPFKRTGPGN